jgi:hypothetical protein
MTDVCFHALPDCQDVERRDALAMLTAGVGYLGVLVVWAVLFIAKPKVAVRIYRERRSNSPLRW